MRQRIGGFKWDDDKVLWLLMLACLGLLAIFGDWPWEDPKLSEAPVAADEFELPSGQQIIDDAVASLDAFWREQFTVAGHAELYVPPTIGYFDHDQPTGRWPCDHSRRESTWAYYCYQEQRIYLSVEIIEMMAADFETAITPSFLIAHEWGHHIRILIDPDALTEFARDSVPQELQAYCAGGLWARAAMDAGIANEDEVARYGRALSRASEEPDRRGTGPQKQAAFDTGFAGGGPAACGYDGPFSI